MPPSFEPTVLTDIRPDALVVQEETFGLLAPVIRFNDEAEIISMCNASPLGLAFYFYSRDLGRVWRVVEALESGMVGVTRAGLRVKWRRLVPSGFGLGREGSRRSVGE